MADERNPLLMDVPDFVREAEEAMARSETFGQPLAEVTIKFGKGLVGEPFTSKSGKELVEVSIPNPDKTDTRPWESFVISPKMIHDNQFGKGVWMKLPEDGTTRLSRSVKTGMDETGRSTWGRETREVTNTELKALMESYKDKSRGSVLSDLSDRKEEKRQPVLAVRRPESRKLPDKEAKWRHSFTPARSISMQITSSALMPARVQQPSGSDWILVTNMPEAQSI